MEKFFNFSGANPLHFHTIRDKLNLKRDIHNIFANIRTIQVLYRSKTGKFIEFYIQLCVQKQVHIRPEFITQGRRTFYVSYHEHFAGSGSVHDYLCEQ